MSGDVHVQFLEGPKVKSLRSTQPYTRVNGEWKYLYRAVDKEGNTIDFLLTAKRDRKAAKRFLDKAISLNDLPETITIDKRFVELFKRGARFAFS